jgi:hypothetical protein
MTSPEKRQSIMKADVMHSQLIVYTIGHSTRRLDQLVELLRMYGIGRLVDVRTIPRSRHNPQFNKETLGVFLRNRRIAYRHMQELGGLRAMPAPILPIAAGVMPPFAALPTICRHRSLPRP